MANPITVAVPEGAWKKVAANVVAGFVHQLLSTPNVYLQTYRLTGVAAPTLVTEGIPFSGKTEEISSSVGIDVYVWCKGGDGSVRVDV